MPVRLEPLFASLLLVAGCAPTPAADAYVGAPIDAATTGDAPPDAGEPSTADGEVDVPRDRFGVREIYPTAPGGREWFLDEDAPASDGVFVPSSATGASLHRNNDGSWRSDDQTGSEHEGTRLQVTTPAGATPWHDVEITGYVRLVAHQFDEAFSWYGRSGDHSSAVPCDGTAYHAQLTYAGGIWFDKEVWHTGGYTGRRGEIDGITTSLVGRWVGFKAMIYDDPARTKVTVEAWLDAAATDDWRMASRIEDSGGWAGGEASCNRPIDAVLLDPRPIVAFRADNAKFDFRSLSVREIAAPR